MTLTEFLLARITEDEAAAKTASLGLGTLAAFGIEVMGTKVYTPAKALAECEAKRRIMELAGEATQLQDFWDGEQGYAVAGTTADPGTAILLALALPYADHPEFQEAWRP